MPSTTQIFKTSLTTVLISVTVASCSLLQTKKETISILVFPDSGSVDQTKKDYSKFIQYLEDSTKMNINLTVGTTYSDVKEKFKGDNVFDVVKLNGVLYSQSFEPKKYQIFAQESSSGQSTYNSIIIVKNNSDIYSLKDLRNKKIALNNKYSTSGSLVPILSLAAVGLRPTTDYQYTFSGSHLKTAKMVITGTVDAGALSWKLLKGYIRNKDIDPSSVRIIDVSSPIPLSPWVLNSNLSSQQKDKIKAAFFGLNDETILKKFSVSSFIPVQGDPYSTLRQNSDVYTGLVND